VPLFKRRTRTDPLRPAAPARSRRAPVRLAEEPDWRRYDSVAGSYETNVAPRTALPARDLASLMDIPKGGRVLDVGTGTGVGARAALEAGAGLVVGVDPSIPMLARAAREGGMARFVAAETIDLPFREASFDAIVSLFAVSHFQKADTALFDMFRVLRSGGRMGVAVWGSGDDEFTRAWYAVAEQYAEHALLQDAYNRAMPGAERFSDPIRLKEALHDAGLRDIWVERRQYRFEMTAEEYLSGRESLAMGRFLRQMLGEEIWEIFRRRVREAFAERFPPEFNDFRDVILAVGHEPD
jgi:ubiquinone/menaquinone biosynthesis C-methylase UbiE